MLRASFWSVASSGFARGWIILAAVIMSFGTGCRKPASSSPASGGMVMPVVTLEAKLQPVTESLSLVGSIAANEWVEIKSETEGTMQEINFQEGQEVEKGALLMRLDETKFTTALAEAEGNFKLSQATFERSEELLKNQLISRQDYDQAAASFNVNQATVARRQRDLKETRIYAPFSGIVGTRSVSPGQVIARDTLLTMLVDLDPVKVEVSVPERFLGQLRIGQDLELTVAAFPTNRFHGSLYFITPNLDPVTRTALVKARVRNPDHQLRMGMFANLELKLKVKEQAVLIAESALVLSQDQTTVWVVATDETVQPRSVKVGLRMPGWVEITEGLQAGEKVIVEGVQKVMPGLKVKSMPAPPS